MRDTGGVLKVGLESIALDVGAAALHPDLNPGPHLKMTVRDTGPGMANDALDRIFEPFYTTKGQGEGTGMGLSVVRGVVKSHGGAITVESTVGSGTVFEVLLPRIITE